MTAADARADIWECPTCGFMFHADHTDIDGSGHSCPNCAEAELTREVARLQAEVTRWKERARRRTIAYRDLLYRRTLPAEDAVEADAREIANLRRVVDSVRSWLQATPGVEKLDRYYEVEAEVQHLDHGCMYTEPVYKMGHFGGSVPLCNRCPVCKRWELDPPLGRG